MSLKILQIIDTLNVGGAEKITVMLANVLAQKGNKSGVVTLVEAGRLSGKLDKDVKFYNLERKSKWDISNAKVFFKIAQRYDLIHVHLRHNLKWLLFWKSILREKLNIIFHDHGNTQLKWNILFWVHQNISHIVVNRKLYNLHSSGNAFFAKQFFLENSINTVISSRNYNPDSNMLRMIVVSNLRRIKNIEFVIGLVKILKLDRQVQLHIYYTNYEKKYLRELKLQTKELGIEDSVHFIHNETEPQELFYKYDIALHPSKRESGPLTILEYIAQGIPFVAFNTGQSVKVIQKKFPEFTIDSFNEDEWLINMNAIINTGRLNYQKFLKHFFDQFYSLDNYYTECRRIYTESLA